MHSGILDQDTFPQILRSISQRKRQGILKLTYPDLEVHVQFVLGKVVDVLDTAVNPVERVIDRLQKAELVPDNCPLARESYGRLFDSLAEHPATKEVVTHGVFKDVLRILVLDAFYSIDIKASPLYKLELEPVECERQYLPAISVGQLLLDQVELETDSERFSILFAPHCLIKRDEEFEGSLSDAERTLYALIGDGIVVEQLVAKSLLSRLELMQALLSLHERVVIDVTEAAKGASAEEVFGVDALASLDSAIESSFGEVDDEAGPDSEADGSEESSEVENELEREPDPGAAEANSRMRGAGFWVEFNTTLTQHPLIPNIILVLWVFGAFLLPWLAWGNLFEVFAGF